MKLDIGCGNKKTEGCTGMDCKALPSVDIVHDMDVFPWPISEDSVEEIYATHYLEHSGNIIACLEEIYRIAKNGCLINIRVPHYASDNFNTDLTHKVAFGYRSFNYFAVNESSEYNFYSDIKFEILERKLKFMGPNVRFNPFKIIGLEFLVNKIPRLYERFFVYLLTAQEIIFKLKVVK